MDFQVQIPTPPTSTHRPCTPRHEDITAVQRPRKNNLTRRRIGRTALEVFWSKGIEDLFDRELPKLVQLKSDPVYLREAIGEVVDTSVSLGRAEEGEEERGPVLSQEERFELINAIIEGVKEYSQFIGNLSTKLKRSPGGLQHLIAVKHRQVDLLMTKPPNFWQWLWSKEARDEGNGPPLSDIPLQDRAGEIKAWKEKLTTTQVGRLQEAYKNYLHGPWEEKFRNDRAVIAAQKKKLETSLGTFFEVTGWRHILIAVEPRLAEDQQVIFMSDNSATTVEYCASLERARVGATTFVHAHQADLSRADKTACFDRLERQANETGRSAVWTRTGSEGGILEQTIRERVLNARAQTKESVQPQDVQTSPPDNRGHHLRDLEPRTPNKQIRQFRGDVDSPSPTLRAQRRSQERSSFRILLLRELAKAKRVRFNEHDRLPRRDVYDRELAKHGLSLWLKRSRLAEFSRDNCVRSAGGRGTREDVIMAGVRAAFRDRSARFEAGWKCPWRVEEVSADEVVEGPDHWPGLGREEARPSYWPRSLQGNGDGIFQ